MPWVGGGASRRTCSADKRAKEMPDRMLKRFILHLGWWCDDFETAVPDRSPQRQAHSLDRCILYIPMVTQYLK